MKILITGVTGFVGSHLAEHIVDLKEKHDIYGMCRWRSPRENLANVYDKIKLVEADLLDMSALVRQLNAVKPDVIFHLGAQSYVLTSFNSPVQTLWTNAIGTTNLLEAVKINKLDPVIHVCSCYDEKTEVHTKRGFLKYNEVKKDDLVLSIDPETKNVSYKPIKKIIVQDYEGAMNRIETETADLLITPNHRLIFNKSPEDRLMFERVDNIRKDKVRFYFPKGPLTSRAEPVEGKNIKQDFYKGKVWCLEIDETHNFAVRRNNKSVFCGNSSEVYGQVTMDDVPIKEDWPLRPSSPYGVSKVAEDMVAYQYHVSYGLKTIRTRMFTHTGPRRGDTFCMSFFAKQVASGELGLQEKSVKVGNLKSIRTFCDVRDAVKAYWIMVNKCKPGEVYNIGGNRTMQVGEALDMLLSLSREKFNIKVDQSLIRPSDVTLQIPCSDKFKNDTGWEPEIPLEKTLGDMLNYWREELKRSPWKAITVVK